MHKDMKITAFPLITAVRKGNTATFELDFDHSRSECDIIVPSVLFFMSVGDKIKAHAPAKLIRAIP